MNTENLGNQLNSIVRETINMLFGQGEQAQLTYKGLDSVAKEINASEENKIEVVVPVGYRPDRTAIESKHIYRKNELLEKYNFLIFQQLPLNGLVQIVTIVEAMFSDVVRAVIIRYPKKLGSKRTLPLQAVLESTTVEEIHLHATDAFLNELSYKSPIDFSNSVGSILSVNFLECSAFHKYVEIKACRDIFIHNRGIANDIYVRKAGSHARVKSGMVLPVDIQYFLESYEHCLQMVEWLEKELHQHWHSSDLEDRQSDQMEMPLPEQEE